MATREKYPRNQRAGSNVSSRADKYASRKRHHVSDHKSSAVLIDNRPRISFDFSERMIYLLYNRKPELRQLIRTGNYVFVDGYLVADSPEYICRKSDGVHLTDFARLNPESCCIVKIAKQAKPRPGVYYSRGHIKPTERYVFSAANRSSHKPSYDEFISFISSGQEPPHNSFGDALVFMMNRENVTEEMLSEETGISVRTIDRLRNKKNNPTLKNIVAICIALTLSYAEFEMMAALAGHNLSGAVMYTTPEIRAYQFLIDVMRYEWTVHECNDFLKMHDLAPLTKI